MKITLHVWRQASPTAEGRLVTYQLNDITPDMSFLEMFDTLNEQLVERNEEPVAFQHDCREGICGSCSMNIDGVNTLACLKPIEEAKADVAIYPLPHMKVVKDLVPDLGNVFAQYASIKPWLQSQSPAPPDRERLQSPEEREKLNGLYECILCFCCTTSCPVFWSEGSYFGPAAIVNAHRFIFDSRDEGAAERLDILNDVDGVWRCRTTFNCTEACPRGIEVTKAIQEVKRALMFRRI